MKSPDVGIYYSVINNNKKTQLITRYFYLKIGNYITKANNSDTITEAPKIQSNSFIQNQNVGRGNKIFITVLFPSQHPL